MTKLQEYLARNIKRRRKNLHLTQEQLAELAQTSTTYIGTIEIGQKFPSLQMIERIADALEVDSWQLFQADLTYSPLVDIEAFKNSLMKNLKSAVDASLPELCAVSNCN